MKAPYLLIAAVAVWACSVDKPQVEGDDITDKTQEEEVEEAGIVEELPVLLPDKGTFNMTEENVAFAVNEQKLAFSLLSKMYNPGESFVMSPLGIQLALGMLFQGADGQTAQEIADVAGFGQGTPDQVQGYGKQVIEGICGSDEVTTRIANILIADDLSTSVSPYYSTQLLSGYYAPTVECDFRENPVDLKKRIDKWSEKVTEGAIPSLLDKVDENIAWYLISALYMKGDWNVPMSSVRSEFIHGNGEKETVPFITTSTNSLGGNGSDLLHYAKCDGFQIARRDLGSGGYGLVVVLPDGELSSVIPALKDAEWAAIMNSMKEEPVWMAMPQIDLSSKSDQVSTLSSLGLNTLFSLDADLSRMLAGERHSKVGNFLQKTRLKVDAAGIEGASVTVVEGTLTDPEPGTETEEPIVFLADHPFLFFVTEQTTGLILYAGVYE